MAVEPARGPRGLLLDERRKFACAFRGLWLVVRGADERHMKIHLAAAVGVMAAALILGLDTLRIAMLLLVIGGIFSAETFNSSVERLAKWNEPEYNPKIRNILDIAAGAVLWRALLAVPAGILIFWPYIT